MKIAYRTRDIILLNTTTCRCDYSPQIKPFAKLHVVLKWINNIAHRAIFAMAVSINALPFLQLYVPVSINFRRSRKRNQTESFALIYLPGILEYHSPAARRGRSWWFRITYVLSHTYIPEATKRLLLKGKRDCRYARRNSRFAYPRRTLRAR